MKKTVKVVMMKKVKSAKDWLEKAMSDQAWGTTQDVVVEKTITLTQDEFQAMANDLLGNHKTYIENSQLMLVDDNDEWHVIRVVCNELPYELYINTEGYDFAMYTGLRVKGV